MSNKRCHCLMTKKLKKIIHINPLNSIEDFDYNEYNSPGEASNFTCREYDDKYGFILFDCSDSKIDDRPFKVFMNSLKNFK